MRTLFVVGSSGFGFFQSRGKPGRLLLAIFAAALLSGCAANRQYRTDCTPCVSSVCESNSIIRYPEYTLGFAEFDDQGWLWDRRQLTNVLDNVIMENSRQPLLMVVFAHGWKHNASSGDGNVHMFQQTLTNLFKVEQSLSKKENRSARRIVGVYLGWRGLSATIEPFRTLSFWSRKSRAHEVGRGGVIELLAGLEAIRKNSKIIYPDRTPTKLVVVGHSFGGALVFSAVASLLADNLQEYVDSKGQARPPEGFGNLVILVNPAFEAARLEPLRSGTEARRFLTNQSASLAIFTSKSDSATKTIFPIGRFFSTAFESHRHSFPDGSVPEKNQRSFQRDSNLRTPGHFEPIITHDLKPKRGSSRQARAAAVEESMQTSPEQSAEQIVQIKKKLRTVKTSDSPPFTTVTMPARANYKPNSPLYIVSVDGSIIHGHNGIDTPTFFTFLREFVMAYGTSD